MAIPFQSAIFTYSLSNSALTITQADNVRSISIYNSSAVVGTVQGTENLGAVSSTAINIGESESYNLVLPENTFVIDSLVITAPAGCTLVITAIK